MTDTHDHCMCRSIAEDESPVDFLATSLALTSLFNEPAMWHHQTPRKLPDISYLSALKNNRPGSGRIRHSTSVIRAASTASATTAAVTLAPLANKKAKKAKSGEKYKTASQPNEDGDKNTTQDKPVPPQDGSNACSSRLKKQEEELLEIGAEFGSGSETYPGVLVLDNEPDSPDIHDHQDTESTAESTEAEEYAMPGELGPQEPDSQSHHEAHEASNDDSAGRVCPAGAGSGAKGKRPVHRGASSIASRKAGPMSTASKGKGNAKRGIGSGDGQGSDDDDDDDRLPKRKRREPDKPDKPDNNNDDDEDDEGKEDSGHGCGRSLDCPIGKRDPAKFEWCRKYQLSRMKDVLQHIDRHHMKRPPHTCPRCCRTFADDDAVEAHRPGCAPPPGFVSRWVADDQRRRYADQERKKMPQEEQWYILYDIVFPDAPRRPSSPYRLSLYEVMQERIEEEGHDILREAFAQARPPSGVPPDADLNQVNQQMVDIWRRRLGIPAAAHRPSVPPALAPQPHPSLRQPPPPQLNTPQRPQTPQGPQAPHPPHSPYAPYAPHLFPSQPPPRQSAYSWSPQPLPERRRLFPTPTSTYPRDRDQQSLSSVSAATPPSASSFAPECRAPVSGAGGGGPSRHAPGSAGIGPSGLSTSSVSGLGTDRIAPDAPQSTTFPPATDRCEVATAPLPAANDVPTTLRDSPDDPHDLSHNPDDLLRDSHNFHDNPFHDPSYSTAHSGSFTDLLNSDDMSFDPDMEL